MERRHDHIPGCARVSAQAPHRLRCRGARDFRWPDPVPFNWALDWFDAELARDPDSRDRAGAVDRRCRAAIKRDKTVVRGAVAPLQPGREFPARAGPASAATICCCCSATSCRCGRPCWRRSSSGVVVIPATTLLTPDELRDRLDRGRAKAVVAIAGPGREIRRPRRRAIWFAIVVGASSKHEGWLAYEEAADVSGNVHAGRRRPTPTIRCCCISPRAPRQNRNWCGTASAAIPSAALSTMYWLGLQPGDVHLNISSPGWAMNSWSCFFAPWNAGATVFVVNQPRFDAKGTFGDHRALRNDDLKCAAYGMAAVHPGEACSLQGQLARSLRRRRAAQSRSDRSGAKPRGG